MAERVKQSRQQTAKYALELLRENDPMFVVPNRQQAKNIRVAFAIANKALYGKAYDIVKIPTGLDLDDAEQVNQRVKEILICEIKSTAKKQVEQNFRKFFFSLTTAELLVAQNLKDQYRFVFVNTLTGEIVEKRLQEVFQMARAVYPCWSIQF